MKKETSNSKNKLRTSKGGVVFIGFVIMFLISVISIEVLRSINSRKALNYGVEGICTIIELRSIKTLFADYSYKVNGVTYYSSVSAPFYLMYPDEMFKIKYLKDNPEINKVLFEQPVIKLKNQYKTRGKIMKIVSNDVYFSYTYKKKSYNRWQVLREDNTFKKYDSVDVIIDTTKENVAIIIY
jgi:hypothetical protein